MKLPISILFTASLALASTAVPEQTTSDPIMLTDLDSYLIPLHDPQHHTHILPPYDDEQFSLSLE